VEHGVNPFGTYWGHILPGLMFMLWGVWWFRRAEPVAGPCGADWEAPVIVVGALVGAAVEIGWAGIRMTPASLPNYQHATMYVGFGIPAALFWLARGGRVPGYLPALGLGGAFGATGLLFVMHASHSPVASSIHMLLGLMLLACAVVSAAEGIVRLPALAVVRSWLTITIGTWFLQAARMLTAGGHAHDAMEGVMRVQLYFIWHLTAVGLAMLAFHVMMRRGGTVPFLAQPASAT
jgi:hypothetical protein